VGEASEVSAGERLVEELREVHAHLRRYHDVCAGLAATAADDPGTADKLRTVARSYLDLVRAHDAAKDTHLLPLLRGESPGMAAIVERLGVEHTAITAQVDAVEQHLDASGDAEVAALLRSLDRLGNELFAHLAYEEAAIAPTLVRWEGEASFRLR
jgi:hypothetical protein